MNQANPVAAPDSIEEALPTFDVLPLSAAVRRAVDEMGYTSPTPVQRAVFEPASRGADLVVQARTGTGKTAAFGLPLVDRLVKSEPHAVQALILSPTRELALQISRQIESLAAHTDIKVTAIYGGAAMQPQIDAVRSGVQIVVGTPGRVLDHLERGTLSVKQLHTFVLDESDEMLSMGFLPQITSIMERLPQGHRTLLFSATLPPAVKRIAESRLKDPEFITLSGDHIGALEIDHYAYTSRGDKASELAQIIEIENPESAIVFCNTRDQTKRIATALQKQGFAADWLNADLSQSDREKVMQMTRESRLRFLVCTDVAARGIDISHLTHVINADFPESTENYVHRTGRTGRAGKTGTAISLITPQDVGNLYMLRLTYKIFPVARELPSAAEIATRRETDLLEQLLTAFPRRGLRFEDLSLARRILTSESAEQIVAGLVRSHLGKHPAVEETTGDARRAALPPRASSRDEGARRDDGRHDKKSDRGSDRKKHGERGSDRDRSREDRTRDERDRKEHAELEKGPGPAHAADLDGASHREAASSGLSNVAEPSSAPRGDSHDDEQRKKDKKRKKKDKDRKRRERDAEGSREARDDSTRDHDDDNRSDDADPSDGASIAADVSPTSLANAPATRDDDAPPESSRRETSESSHRPLETISAADVLEQLSEDPTERVFVDVGRRDGAYREDFIEALEEQGFQTEEIRFVKVRETHTFVGVPPELLERALDVLDGANIAGYTARAEKARPKARD